MITFLLETEIFLHPCSYFIKEVENDPVVKKSYMIDSKCGQITKIQEYNRAFSPMHTEKMSLVHFTFLWHSQIKIEFSDDFSIVQQLIIAYYIVII